MEGVSRKRSDLRCRRGRKSLGDSGLVALAALGCHIRRHDMLAVSLTAVFRHLGTADSLLKASPARPSQKREEGQGDHTHCPEAMSLVTLHLPVWADLLPLGVLINPGYFLLRLSE